MSSENQQKTEWADLHIHSAQSDDGNISIDEIIELTSGTHETANPIKMIAITDHEEFDFDGLEKGLEFAREKGIQLIPGIEISTEDTLFGFEKVHVVSYFPDYKPEELRNSIIYEIAKEMQKEKNARNDKYKRILVSYGLLTPEEAKNIDFGRSKATLVQKLFDKYKEKGEIEFEEGETKTTKSIKDISGVWQLVEDRRFRQDREKKSAETVIWATTTNGGIPVIAHPLLLRYKETRECFLTRALQDYKKEKKINLQAVNVFFDFFNSYWESENRLGLEIHYPYTKTREYREFEQDPLYQEGVETLINIISQYCKDKGIRMSGGSDYHGPSSKEHMNIGDAKEHINIGDGKICLDDAKRLLKIN